MTWSRFDDAARKHPKALMAGNEAWGFWCAAIMYCNQYHTDGFIPDSALATELLPCPISPAKAKRLAQRLCEARLGPDRPGLFVRDDVRRGYIVHDFLDWNPSKSEVEDRRRKDRERKRRTGGDGAESGPASARIPDGSREESPPETQRSDSGTAIGKSLDSASRAGARDPARPPARPCLTQPAAGKGAADGSFIPCPPDLDLLESQKANLEMAGAKRWQVDAMVLEIRTKLLGSSERRTLDGWRNYLAGAVTRRWSNPAERPKEPPPKGPADDPNRKMAAEALKRHRRRIREQNQRILEQGIPGLKTPTEAL